MKCPKCGNTHLDSQKKGFRHCNLCGLIIPEYEFTKQQSFNVVIHHYFAGETDAKSYIPYPNNVSWPEDCPVKGNVTLRDLLDKTGWDMDGEEIEITIKLTGKRPHGDRIVRKVAPHTYALETEEQAQSRLGRAKSSGLPEKTSKGEKDSGTELRLEGK